MIRKTYTIIMSSSGSRRTRKISWSAGHFWGIGLLLACAFGGAVAAASYVVRLYSAAQTVHEENARLHAEHAAMTENYDGIRENMRSIQQVLNDVEHLLGLPMTKGPAPGEPLSLGGGEDGMEDLISAVGGSELPPDWLESGAIDPPDDVQNRIAWLFKWAERLQGGVDSLEEVGRSKQDELRMTPSVVPLDTSGGVRYLVSSLFGRRISPITDRYEFHAGIDLAAPSGAPVIAAAHGVVRSLSKASTGSRKGLGNHVVIQHGPRYRTVYGHLNAEQPFAEGLKVGAKVERNQVIGYVGTTGRSTGNHLHYEVLDQGRHVDPKPYLLDLEERRR